MVKLIECPRDAMQGFENFIPTALKIEYLNLLMQVGFDTLDFGSFVSPKAIPQMKDTRDVLAGLNRNSATKLLAIVANSRGAEEAADFDQITYLGFPFSISETFQLRNTNSSIKQSISTVESILSICHQSNKQAVVYLSMGFGNPYGDEWSPKIVEKYASILVDKGCRIISVADTTGVSTPENIGNVFELLSEKFPQTEIGVHLHSRKDNAKEKINAAYNSGCIRFDGAIKGFGGCPMAADTLTGNIATETLISLLQNKGEQMGIDMGRFSEAENLASKVFA